jgi:NADPH:quinone reductase-like Zn-dependent oxidoreductase
MLQIVCTASSKNHGFLKELGAHEAIDYTKIPFEEAVREVDVVFDTRSGDVRRRSWRVLKKRRYPRFHTSPCLSR